MQDASIENKMLVENSEILKFPAFVFWKRSSALQKLRFLNILVSLDAQI